MGIKRDGVNVERRIAENSDDIPFDFGFDSESCQKKIAQSDL
jgi:hypothetical protein